MPRNAYTLLEVVLALALAAVVLGILGMAVDIQLRSADAGRNEVEQAQLARSLLHRIADDLRATAPQGEQTGGLSGTRNELEFEICRLPRPQRPAKTSPDADTAPAVNRPSDARMVSYSVIDPTIELPSETLDPANRRQGLIRREMESAAYAMEQAEAADLDRAAEVLAQEVTAIEFTYFDGDMASEEWDSQTEGRLPTAVGVTVLFRRAQRGRSLVAPSPLDDQSEQVAYSLVVRLPNASVGK